MVPLVNLFFFCSCFHPFSFLFFSFSPDTQALQCMLISLQAELDIQRYLMKIESSQRVSTFLFSALSRISPPAFSLNCVWHSNPCRPLNRKPVLCLVCPASSFKSLKAKCLQHSEMCILKLWELLLKWTLIACLLRNILFIYHELSCESAVMQQQVRDRGTVTWKAGSPPGDSTLSSYSRQRSRGSKAETCIILGLRALGLFLCSAPVHSNLGSSACYWHTF